MLSGAYYRRRGPIVTRIPDPPYAFNHDHPLARDCWGYWLFSDSDAFVPGRNLVGDWAHPVTKGPGNGTGSSDWGYRELPHGRGYWFNISGDYSGLKFGTFASGQHGWVNVFAGDPNLGTYADGRGNDNRGSIHIKYFTRASAPGGQYLIEDGPGTSLTWRHDNVNGGGIISGMGISSGYSSRANPDYALRHMTLVIHALGVDQNYILDCDEVVPLAARGATPFNGSHIGIGNSIPTHRGGVYNLAAWSHRTLEPDEARQLDDPADPWPLLRLWGRRTYHFLPAAKGEAGAFVDFGSVGVSVSGVTVDLLARERDVGAAASAALALVPAPTATRIRDLESDTAAGLAVDGDLEVSGFADFGTTISAALSVSASIAGTVNFGTTLAASSSVDALLGREFALAAPASLVLSAAAANVAPIAVDDGPFPVGANWFLDGDAGANDIPGEAGEFMTWERTGLGPFFGDIVLDFDGLFTYLPNLGVTNQSDVVGYRIRDRNANVSNDALIRFEIGGYVDLAVGVAVASSVVAVPGFFRNLGAAMSAALAVVPALDVTGEQMPFHVLGSVEVCPMIEGEFTVGPEVLGEFTAGPAVDGDFEVNPE